MMRKLVKIKAPAVPRIADTSDKVKRFSGEELAEALGARPTGKSMPTNLPAPAHVQLVAQVVSEIVSPECSLQAVNAHEAES